MIIEKDRVVSIEYVLKDDAGETLDSSGSGDPLVYLHGHANIIPGLEKQLEGKKSGDKVSAVVKPEEAYGTYDDEMVIKVPKSNFEGTDDLAIGMQFEAHDPNGVHVVTVTDIEGDVVTVDANHPLAGVTLHFDVSVTDVREANAEELAAGHIHSGCDCGCEGDCEDEEGCGDGCGCGHDH
jgi:FKBP-type peptidyl-prolyl cis-trans isomerase SlyD